MSIYAMAAELFRTDSADFYFKFYRLAVCNI